MGSTNRIMKSLILLSLALISSIGQAQERSFATCIVDWQNQALANGLSNTTVKNVIPSLRRLPEVIDRDSAQPEFSQTFAQYLDKRLTAARIDRGQALLATHANFLSRLDRQHGVAARYLLAFWGLETNFGNYLGNMPTLSALATLACDPRRSDYFNKELMIALALMERDSLSPAQMRGSWAGAMGHTQFMPTSYQRYAIDGDGDGHINLWQSAQDALASAANFLQQLGWHQAQDWGHEVVLPDNFPYAISGLRNQKSVNDWRDLGVTLSNGEPLPPVKHSAAIIIPAGHKGPAFLVYENFHTIMKWNHSESYALSVSLLADQIAGKPPLQHPPSLNEAALSRHTIKRMQSTLNNLRFNAGVADGIIGPNTRIALSQFQTNNDLIADGYPDEQTLEKLGIKPRY